MRFDLKQSARAAVACVLATIFVVPQDVLAQSHVVSPADLQKAVLTASQTRQQNLAKVKELFSSEMAQQALKSAHMDPAQVKTAVSTLNDANSRNSLPAPIRHKPILRRGA